MNTFKPQSTRKETKDTIQTASIFQYGNGYRVKYIKTDTDKNNTRMLAGFDKDFSDLSQAEALYTDAVKTIETN